jgi:type I restriction enzyme S subunit
MDKRPLGDVLSLTMGQSPPGTSCNGSGIGTPLLNGPTEFGSRCPTPAQWTTDARRVCDKDAVLLCVRGSTTGRTNRADQPYAIGRGVAAIEATDSIDQSFAYFSLVWSIPSLLERTTGSVFPNLSRDDISSIELAWPDRRTRGAIAEVLGALDDKIEANRTQVSLLQDLISVTWEYVSRDNEDWPVVAIGDVAKIVGGSTPSTSVADYWAGGSFAWATPKDLSRLSSVPLLSTERSITEAGLSQISSGLLPQGTVLLSSRAPIGYLAIAEVPVAINQGFIALLPGQGTSHLYLWQWIAHHMNEITDRANGTTFLEISKANFRPISFALPPEGLIKQWADSAEAEYRLIVQTEREIADLTRMRDTLLPKLMSGELRVRDAEHLVEDAV